MTGLDDSGAAPTTTQRTLDMLRKEWQREERVRLATLIDEDLRLHDDTGHPRDEGYMQCFRDVLALLGQDAP